MIEKMKKLTFLVTDREYDAFIASLRDLGVVDIDCLKKGAQSPELQAALALEGRYKAAMQTLSTYKDAHERRTETSPLEPDALLAHLEARLQDEAELRGRMASLSKSIQTLAPLGDFETADIERLAKATGMTIAFFRCAAKSFREEWAEQLFAIPVAEEQKMVYFATFSHEEPVLDAERIQLPEVSPSALRESLAESEKELASVHKELASIATYETSTLEKGLAEARSEIQLQRVLLSDERMAADVLRLLVGWVRADRAAALIDYLEKAHIYYEMEDPAFDDEVPIAITNNRFSRLFEPILRMYSLPNYHDLDPTVFFAPFFMLFFGLCMGDAGYGLLILTVGLFLTLKGTGEMKAYGKLATYLGASTVVCGFATATFFGIDISQWSCLSGVKPFFLTDKGVGKLFGYTPMMVISVLIGLVQVLLGMILKGCKALKNYGWPYAVATFSWVSAIVLALLLYGLPALGVALPSFVEALLLGLIGVSAIGIFLYNSPASYRRPALGLLSNIGGGVWATYGMATGLLGDLLSYIRLFALGLTGGVLGGVFNSLALDMTSSLPLVARLPAMLVILLLGHGITFALSMISAFVHPMRLTFVEFFKNADYSGGGRAYEPFQNCPKS